MASKVSDMLNSDGSFIRTCCRAKCNSTTALGRNAQGLPFKVCAAHLAVLGNNLGFAPASASRTVDAPLAPVAIPVSAPTGLAAMQGNIIELRNIIARMQGEIDALSKRADGKPTPSASASREAVAASTVDVGTKSGKEIAADLLVWKANLVDPKRIAYVDYAIATLSGGATKLQSPATHATLAGSKDEIIVKFTAALGKHGIGGEMLS